MQVREPYRDLAHIIHEASATIAILLARGLGQEARGEYFRSETQLFLLVPSLVHLAWPVGEISRQTVTSKED
jgi:hypothetical protein